MNSEGSHFNNRERGSNAEIAELVGQLDTEAERLGIELQETDFLKVGADEAMKLHGKIEMILSVLAIAAGVVVAYDASESLFESGPESADLMRLAARLGLAAVGGSGFALLFKGLGKLEVGYKRLHGYIRAKELLELDGRGPFSW